MFKQKQKLIIMIGPPYTSLGGMASVIASYRNSGLFEKWPVLFLPTHVEGNKFQKLTTAVWALVKLFSLILLQKVKVLHIHVARQRSFWRKSIFMAVANFFNIPILLHLHSGGFPEFYWKECGDLQKRIIRFLLNKSACIIVLSSQWKQLLKGITTNINQRIIYNFIDVPEIGINTVRDEATLLFLGKLNHEKGLFDLLRAIQLIKDEFPSLCLEVCGEGDKKHIKESAKKNGVDRQLKLNGWIAGKKKEALMRTATIYILPSYYEGLPMGVLESMAYGLPVIATNVGGLPDVIKDGYNGELIEPGDIKALAEKIRKLLMNPQKREDISKVARETVINKFSTEAVLPKINCLYDTYGVTPNVHYQKEN